MRESDESTARRSHSSTGSSPPRLADGRFYRALASPHRRRLLYYLLDREERTAAELASVLSGWEATATGTMYDSADRSSITLQLRHKHLPQLAETGLIAYDPDGDTVRLESLQPQVTHLIRQSVEAEGRDRSD